MYCYACGWKPLVKSHRNKRTFFCCMFVCSIESEPFFAGPPFSNLCLKWAHVYTEEASTLLLLLLSVVRVKILFLVMHAHVRRAQHFPNRTLTYSSEIGCTLNYLATARTHFRGRYIGIRSERDIQKKKMQFNWHIEIV